MKKYYSFFILIILLITEIQVQTSCANIVPPNGGPRDTIPPVLVKAVPKDSALNFNANKITLTFNEYIQLDPQLAQSIITSPNPVQQPYAESKLQSVTIRLKDSLKPNTTYSINFGNAIKDINENNPYKNFTYVFSTGNSIANGSLSGKVELAQTGSIDTTLLVILHKDLNDSAIKKERPYYLANLDSAGRFNFHYLAHGKYNVFVLPNDYTKKYDDSSKTFAFLNEPVTIDSTISEPLILYAYNEFPASKTSTSTPTAAPSPNKQTKKKITDTIVVFTTNLQNKDQDLLSDFIIDFAKPIAHFDSSKVSFTDTTYHTINNYQITTDTSLKKITLKYPWKEDEYFKLVIQKDAFEDSAGHTLAKADTISFKTSSENAYGSIRLRFINLELDKNPVLQFVQNDIIVDSVALTTAEFFRTLCKPGDYDLRILYDADKNLTWTPGSFELKKQPEIVIRIPRKLTIKQNWDNEVNVNL